MAGSVDPPDGTPDGTPEGLPGRGEDEYRPVVFDESFVRAARLQELSARERMDDDAPAVRSRPDADHDGLDPALDRDAEYEYAYDLDRRHHWRTTRRRVRRRRRGHGHTAGTRVGALILVLLVATVFAAAIHFGSRYPYQPPPDPSAEPLRTTLVALTPTGPVPGGRPGDLYARSPAAQYRPGAAGVALPPARRTTHFSEGQVMTALATAKDFLVHSSLDPDVLTGTTARPVRLLLDPDQHPQFDRSVDFPAADGSHATGGWLVRFDPAHVTLADPGVRVRGTLRVTEASADTLEITSDHTFAYALRPADPGTGPDDASLFTVRRELRFRFDHDDLRMHRAELVTSHLQAGPMDCSADLSGALRPLLAGRRPTTAVPPATDPYAPTPVAATRLCAALSPDSLPSPP
ncbi:SCO2583 family membrane protein [Streptomyces roseolilacinus]|uniref:SCO2583 family membrane protein n=1 Tax=Streptomyces roseolilacinus TaxID=66904 RepID=UPI00380A35AC